nr:DUF6266 family protein [Pedobacter panaciterrae]
MAKINKGILGAVSGKIGPVIGGIWKGIPYVRPVPKTIKKSNTVAQIESRQKLRFMNELLVPFHPYVSIGFIHDAKHRTEISAAFSENYHKAVVGKHPNYLVVYHEFVISKGNLPMIEEVVMELQAPDVLKLTWLKNGIKNTSFDDQVMLVIYCPELHKTDGFSGGVKRADEQCTFKFNPKMADKRLEVFVSISSLNRKKIGNSQYLGSI